MFGSVAKRFWKRLRSLSGISGRGGAVAFTVPPTFKPTASRRKTVRRSGVTLGAGDVAAADAGAPGKPDGPLMRQNVIRHNPNVKIFLCHKTYGVVRTQIGILVFYTTTCFP
jgi:hypothetical protein